MSSAAKKARVRRSVLIVDDSSLVRKHLRELFLSHGFSSCWEAANGLEAIQTVTSSQPDIIILDLSMPVMNGVQAAPELKKLAPAVPIILFTLHGDQMIVAQLSALGISALCAKSEPLDKLLVKADELLDD